MQSIKDKTEDFRAFKDLLNEPRVHVIYIQFEGEYKDVADCKIRTLIDNDDYAVIHLSGWKYQWLKIFKPLLVDNLVVEAELITIDQALSVPSLQQLIVYNLDIFTDRYYDYWHKQLSEEKGWLG